MFPIVLSASCPLIVESVPSAWINIYCSMGHLIRTLDCMEGQGEEGGLSSGTYQYLLIITSPMTARIPQNFRVFGICVKFLGNEMPWWLLNSASKSRRKELSLFFGR